MIPSWFHHFVSRPVKIPALLRARLRATRAARWGILQLDSPGELCGKLWENDRTCGNRWQHMVKYMVNMVKIPSGIRFWTKIFTNQSIDSHVKQAQSNIRIRFSLRIEPPNTNSSNDVAISPRISPAVDVGRCIQRSTRRQVTCGPSRCYMVPGGESTAKMWWKHGEEKHRDMMKYDRNIWEYIYMLYIYIYMYIYIWGIYKMIWTIYWEYID